MNFTVLWNPIVYGYFDNFFVKEVLRILKFVDIESEVYYEHHDDDKEAEEV
jgi:hypothetical protein